MACRKVRYDLGCTMHTVFLFWLILVLYTTLWGTRQAALIELQDANARRVCVLNPFEAGLRHFGEHLVPGTPF